VSCFSLIEKRLPIPIEAPVHFRMLPEYLFDNVTEYYDYLARSVPHDHRTLDSAHSATRYDTDPFDDPDKDILITFAITFLSPGYVNNPFLKAKLVTVCGTSTVMYG
jgi:ubiquitin conjugation factor E4 B